MGANQVSTDFTPNVSSAFSAGVQYTRSEYESFGATGDGLVSGALNLVGSAATTFGDQSFREQTALGFYVQEQVGYKNRRAVERQNFFRRNILGVIEAIQEPVSVLVAVRISELQLEVVSQVLANSGLAGPHGADKKYAV